MALPPVRGLRLDEGLLIFDFKPSVGILAKDLFVFGVDIRSFHEPLKRSVQQVMIPSFRQNFDVGGRPPWPPLSEFAERRHEDEGGSGILVKTGLLRQVAGQLNIWTIDRKSASVRALPQRVWYGYLHQAGFGSFGARVSAAGGDVMQALKEVVHEAEEGRGQKAQPIPQREFIMFQGEDYDDIEKVFAQWLDERIRRFVARGLGDKIVGLRGFRR